MSDGNQPLVPSVERILSALDVEIANQRQSVARTGLTQWVLLGALTGLLWKFLDLNEKHGADLRIGLLVAVVLLSSLDAYALLRWLFGEEPLPDRNRRWNFLNTRLGSLGIYIAIIARWLLTIPLLFWIGSPGFVPSYPLLGLGYLFLSFLFLIIVIGIVRYEVTKQTEADSPTRYLLIASAVLVLSFCIINLTFLIHATVGEWRMAFVMAAMVYLVGLCIMEASPVRWLDALVKIRRQLAFGDVRPEEAGREAMQILEGMHYGEVLLRAIEQLRKLFSERLNQRRNFAFQMKSRLDYNDQNPSTQNERTRKSLLNFSKKVKTNDDISRARLSKRLAKLDQRVTFVTSQATPEDMAHIGAISKRFADTVTEFAQEIGDADAEWAELETRLVALKRNG